MTWTMSSSNIENMVRLYSYNIQNSFCVRVFMLQQNDACRMNVCYANFPAL